MRLLKFNLPAFFRASSSVMTTERGTCFKGKKSAIKSRVWKSVAAVAAGRRR
jgi:hypothetical protein